MGARRGVTGYMVSHSGRFKFERRADRRGLTLLSASRPVFPSARERARVSGISPVNLSMSSQLNYILLYYIILLRDIYTDGRSSGWGGKTNKTHETVREKKYSSAHITRLCNTGDGLKVEIILLLLYYVFYNILYYSVCSSFGRTTKIREFDRNLNAAVAIVCKQ